MPNAETKGITRLWKAVTIQGALLGLIGIGQMILPLMECRYRDRMAFLAILLTGGLLCCLATIGFLTWKSKAKHEELRHPAQCLTYSLIVVVTTFALLFCYLFAPLVSFRLAGAFGDERTTASHSWAVLNDLDYYHDYDYKNPIWCGIYLDARARDHPSYRW